ncbi:jg22065 [Pararge aegeria aegeria]|uniref:Jg22065 protein n=1 Tax=Pararge aegeria aegeria TaxID=348720 RepID=A0A8S4RPT8_9NEOP|nr:jg22065 [Pararge aegeria aegeria]
MHSMCIMDFRDYTSALVLFDLEYRLSRLVSKADESYTSKVNESRVQRTTTGGAQRESDKGLRRPLQRNESR